MTRESKTPDDFLSDPETQLMMRFVSGDDSAFDRIVENFQRQVFGIIHKYVGNAATAEDCAQEVFLRLYRMRKSWRPSARLSTLIYRVTTNLCLNLVRDEDRRRAVSLDEPYGGDGLPLSAALPGERQSGAADQVEAKERAEIVRRALSSLPDRQRLALVLHRFEGLSYAQIAESLDTNVDAVKALLSRARQSLAEILKKDIEAGNL